MLPFLAASSVIGGQDPEDIEGFGFFPERSVTLFNQGNHIRIMLWMMYPRWLGLQYVEEHSVSQPCNFWWSRSIPVCGCSQNNYVSVRVTRNF